MQRKVDVINNATFNELYEDVTATFQKLAKTDIYSDQNLVILPYAFIEGMFCNPLKSSLQSTFYHTFYASIIFYQ